MEKVLKNVSLMETQPLFAISDRKHLMDLHMRLIEEHNLCKNSLPPNANEITSSMNAPNASLPMVLLNKEKMIAIQQILQGGLDQFHPGVFLLCRSMLPATKRTCLQILVDDPTCERALRVIMYNYPKAVHPGDILAIMHPWFKSTADGLAAIRVENPMHVHVFKGTEDLLKETIWKEPLPVESGAQKQILNAKSDPAEEGNRLFAKKDYDKALDAYAEAIRQAPGEARTSVLYANRAFVYLKKDQQLLALQETEKGLQLYAANITLLLRKGKSLLLLKRFDEAIGFLEETRKNCKEVAEDKKLCKLITDAHRMQNEHSEGQYDQLQMLQEAKKSPFLEYHTDYLSGLFELQEIDGKGRGLVAVRDIEPGTLLMVCKAVACVDPGGVCYNVATKRAESIAPLVNKVSEKLMNNPDLGDEFYQLYAGEKSGFLKKCDASNPVDIDRITNIIRLNMFATEGIFFGHNYTEQWKRYGLWILPSYINHSCVDCNCMRYTIGDFMFIRASKPVRKGEELLTEYIGPMQCFGKRSRAFRDQYGFVCTCRLCTAMQHLSKETLDRFDEISEQLDANTPADALQLKSLLREVLKYHPDKATNFLATRIRDVLSAAIIQKSPREAYALFKENFEIHSVSGDLFLAYMYAKELADADWLERKETAHWIKKTKTLAKVLYGDERLAVMNQI